MDVQDGLVEDWRPRSRRPRRVLLAEDDKDLRRLVARMLVKEGYEVLEASSGVGLLAGIELTGARRWAESFDVIVSDIEMPGISAFDALGDVPLRTLGIPIVFMTAYGSREARARARTLGAVAYPEVEAGPPPLVIAARRPRVLVADDDEDMRRLVAGVLRQEGYSVIQAGDGIGVMRWIDRTTGGWTVAQGGQDRFDAIVSDIQMPDLTALDVLDALACRDIDIPMVLITAYGNPEMRAEAQSLGALAVLDKPLHWPDLRRAVRRAVAAQ